MRIPIVIIMAMTVMVVYVGMRIACQKVAFGLLYINYVALIA